MSVTLRDVATKASVSPATVSRVLNNYPLVNEATRTAVLAAAEALGYPLEGLRRPGRSQRTVLLVQRLDVNSADNESRLMGHEYERVVAPAAQAVFEENGLNTRTERCRMHQEDAVRFTSDPAVAGLILLGGIVDRDFLHCLTDAGLPFVCSGAHVLPLDSNCVMADVAHGVAEVIAHLVARGRRRIGLVNGPCTTSTSQEKYLGLRLGLALHDLPFTHAQVSEGEFSPESGYAQTIALVRQCPDLDAIIYADDAMAFGGLRALREANRSCPADVSVVGFGDYEIARFTDPPLTSVNFDMSLTGRLAARRLLALINEPADGPCLTYTPTHLVVRGSS